MNKNKGTLIKLLNDQLILVNDEVIKEGTLMYDIDGDIGIAIGNDTKEWEGNKKIIAESPNIKLSKEVACVIDWVNTEESWEEYRKKRLQTMGNPQYWEAEESKKSFIAGFQNYQSLNKKIFTEEDIKTAIKFGKEIIKRKTDIEIDEDGAVFIVHSDSSTETNAFINSLKIPKQYEVEYEMKNDVYIISNINE